MKHVTVYYLDIKIVKFDKRRVFLSPCTKVVMHARYILAKNND